MTDGIYASAWPVASATAPDSAWREAVIDALVVSDIYDASHDGDPRKAVRDLLALEREIAIDPRVSRPAADLVELGKSQKAAELDAARTMLRVCWLLIDDIARYGSIIGMDKAQRMACALLRKHKALGW